MDNYVKIDLSKTNDQTRMTQVKMMTDEARKIVEEGNTDNFVVIITGRDNGNTISAKTLISAIQER